MKILSTVSKNKFYIIYILLLFASLVTLVSLVPLFGDDWDWASNLGDIQLESWFEGYNGRYSGNLMVIALTKCMPLRSICIAGFITFLCVLPSVFIRKKSLFLLSASTFFVLSMSRYLLVQGVLWTAGFCNYVTPMVLTFVFFIMMNGIFEEDRPKYTKKQTIALSAVSLVIGFISVMFMENVTIYILLMSVCLIVISLYRFKRVYLPLITHLCGGIIGTVCMFTNSAYKAISQGTDNYRTAPTNQEDLPKIILEHLSSIVKFLLSRATPLIICVCAFCIISAIVKTREKNKKVSVVLWISSVLNLTFTVILTVFRWANPFGITASAILLSVSAIAFCVTVLITVFVCIKNKRNILKMLFVLSGVPILIGPMLFITPFGPRCVLPSYICLVFFCTMFVEYLWRDLNLDIKFKSLIFLIFVAVSIGFITYYMIIYIPVNKYHRLRLEYMEKQLDMAYTEIVVPNLPHQTFLQCGDITVWYWQRCFKNYYGIDQSIKFKVLSPEEFDEWVTEFEKGGNQ